MVLLWTPRRLHSPDTSVLTMAPAVKLDDRTGSNLKSKDASGEPAWEPWDYICLINTCKCTEGRLQTLPDTFCSPQRQICYFELLCWFLQIIVVFVPFGPNGAFLNLKPLSICGSPLPNTHHFAHFCSFQTFKSPDKSWRLPASSALSQWVALLLHAGTWPRSIWLLNWTVAFG